MAKRLFDIVFSLLGIIFSFPIFIILALMVKLDSKGPVFYRGLRVGKGGKLFHIYKFRTMVPGADKIGGPSTAADDPRLTRVGKLLRKHNLDELPQLINILKGEMSFVGPRPEVPSEVATYSEEEKKIILSVKPGITDFATLENVHEEEILKGSADPHQAYIEKIKPKKIKLAIKYVKERSFLVDIKILIKTVLIALK